MRLFVKNLLFTLLIPGTVAVYLPLLIVRNRQVEAVPILLILGVLLLAVGAAIYLWTVWDFATSGRGTPLPLDAPKTLVVRGLYQYCRNPMYLGVLLVILGWSAVFTEAWLLLYSLVVFGLVDVFVIYYEEPTLLRLFGQQYETYRQSVGKWLPRIHIGK